MLNEGPYTCDVEAGEVKNAKGRTVACVTKIMISEKRFPQVWREEEKHFAEFTAWLTQALNEKEERVKSA